jgi:hypothetical protein
MEHIGKTTEYIKKLEKENEELKIKLKKYANPDRYKKFYEKNREKLLKRNSEYHKRLPKEKKQEYAKRAYQRKKEKLKRENKKNKEI